MPTRSQLHPVNRLLTDFSIGYSQSKSGLFIARQIGIVQRATERSFQFGKWPKDAWWRDHVEEVSPYDPSPIAHFTAEQVEVTCKDARLKKFWPDALVADDQMGYREATVEFLTDQILLNMDIRAAAEIFDTGLWTSNTEQTGVTGTPTGAQFKRWDESGSTPIDDFLAAKESVAGGCANEANTVVMNRKTLNALRANSTVAERFKYTQGGNITVSDLEQLFDIKFIVAAARKNTADQGQTASISNVWGNHALFLYVTPGEKKLVPNAVTTFVYNEVDRVRENGAAIRTWRENDPEGEYLEAASSFKTLISANDAGVFYYNAVS